MPTNYPIRGNRDNYRGSDPTKIAKRNEYNATADRLERHVNKQIENGKRGTFTYALIAIETGIDPKLVENILYSVDCGNTGFTIASDDN
jgi:hypothetical protein